MPGMESLSYRAYRLDVAPHGRGYKIFIWPPGGGFSLSEIPYCDEPSEREATISKAMAVVDAAIEKKRRA